MTSGEKLSIGAAGITIAFMNLPVASILLVAALMAQAPNSALPISGKWHLIPGSSDEIHVQGHRVDLVFRGEQNALSGAVINRVTGEDIPLRSLQFNGSVLTLQMAGTNPDSIPATLTMIRKGDRFEGRWMRGATEVGPMLKLVRFQ